MDIRGASSNEKRSFNFCLVSKSDWFSGMMNREFACIRCADLLLYKMDSIFCGFPSGWLFSSRRIFGCRFKIKICLGTKLK